jgi:CDP-diacylglycerol--glycerol-3-phosphate 3-phosphatidyltransferase
MARVLMAPVLAWLAATGHEMAFAWLLIAALATDLADGLVARMFHLGTRFGALLDSAADVLTMSVATYGIWVFHREVLRDHEVACAAVIGGGLAVCIVALLRYGRLASFHTYLAKATAYVLGFFLATLFLFGFVPWLFVAAIALSVLGSVEELALIWYLPRWRADVRGLWWVLRERA